MPVYTQRRILGIVDEIVNGSVTFVGKSLHKTVAQVVANIVMAYAAMACIVMAYVVMADIVMAP